MTTTERTRTRAIIMVHSHVGNDGKALDCSIDLKSFQTSKSIKGTGGASIMLLPRRNYMNFIYPNDVVNIYVDTGNGKGFVRLFFGYVDRIREKETTDDAGKTTTGFMVTCTDFSKAIDKTEIYFNPMLANREEFVDNASGQSLLGGGHALRTRGIIAHGTPAQFIENLLSLLLGFGQQWTLPRSYPTTNFLDKARSQRRQRAKQRIPQDVQDALRAAFNTDVEDFVLGADVQAQILQKQAATQLPVDTTQDTELVNDYTRNQAALSTVLSALVQLQAYQAVLREQIETSSASILDILSLDFIESLTVDGYITSKSVWTNTGTLASMLYGWSNEPVNELCFDLRPVAVDAPDQCFGTRYSTDADELGINVNGTSKLPAHESAVQYVPAVVFREYPYSVVQGLDLTNFNVLGNSVGYLPFGPVFAVEPNREGRKIYNYETAGVSALTPEKCLYDENASPLKHIDVVVIPNSDIRDIDVGRSDADVFNLFELYALGPQEIWKYILREILPILTPVSIQRHGLRLRQITTKFANYSRDQLCTGGSGVDTAQIRRNLMRWAILVDHWYQHNIEYLSGSLELKGRPEIRVGYRADLSDRSMSYYVEQVDQRYEYPGALFTTLQVSRGQRNDPFPAYIPPILSKTGGTNAGAPTGQGVLAGSPDATVPTAQQQQQLQNQKSSSIAQQGGGNRSANGRLGKFFPVKDLRANVYSVGAEAKFGGPNDVDKQANIPGVSVVPENLTNNQSSAVGDFSAPLQGDNKVT